MNAELLIVAIEESIDAETVDHLKTELSFFEDDVDFHPLPKSGPQANILLFGITSIAIVFGAAFIKKLGDKAAEDSYPYIKRAFVKLYQNYFGKDPQYQMRILSSSENKAPGTKYSLIFALYCTSPRGKTLKFLYETGWTHSQFDEATKVYLESI